MKNLFKHLRLQSAPQTIVAVPFQPVPFQSVEIHSIRDLTK